MSQDNPTCVNNYQMYHFDESRRLKDNRNSKRIEVEDILIRLREWDDQQPPFRTMNEAADEIEHLREQNEYLKANIEMLLRKVVHAPSE